MSILSFEGVSLVLGHEEAASCALRDVSFELSPGQLITLMGASGSGKTSLLNVAAGFTRPTSGRVGVLGQDLSKLDETRLCLLRRDTIGFVFQSLNLLPALSARDNVQVQLFLNGWSSARRKERLDELLELARLSDKGDCYPDELSVGQQQRVAVLRAIAHRPKLVLMDEPTSCLDSAHAAELMELVGELNRREGISLIIATHDQAVAEKTSRILGLKDGRIAFDRPVAGS